MGFRVGNFMSVWSTELSKSGNTTRVRLSSSRKNKMGEYEQDFSGFCTFIGKAHEAAYSRIGQFEMCPYGFLLSYIKGADKKPIEICKIANER